MEVETAFKEGFLLFPPHGILVKKKSWQKKYCKLFKSSKHGIERLEIFECEEDAWKNRSTTIITLENCIKISPAPQKYQQNVFAVTMKNMLQMEFATLFEQEMLDWISSFQTVAFKDDSSGNMIEEDNDLYCSSGEGIFVVKLIPTSTSTRCGLADTNYTLIVTQNALQLRSPYPSDRLLYTWPFMYIRRYGYRDGHITFEAGRKCDSGEGVFQLESNQQQEIFRYISTSMKAWRNVVRKDEPPDTPPPVPASNPPIIQCGDGQFQAALSMEPGSRTPLPPSPTSATNSRFVDEISSVLENTHIKQKPAKPPRKGKSNECIDPGLLKKLQGDPNSTYDDIEVRKEAWKTLGVDNLTHNENVCSDDEESKKVITKEKTIQSSRKIITTPQGTEEAYDKLQHFGQPTTLTATSVYRQLTPLTPIKQDDLSWNEYDVIEEQEFRSADDSHLGYGVIRKNPAPQPSTKENNEGQEYSFVVKPKRT